MHRSPAISSAVRTISGALSDEWAASALAAARAYEPPEPIAAIPSVGWMTSPSVAGPPRRGAAGPPRGTARIVVERTRVTQTSRLRRRITFQGGRERPAAPSHATSHRTGAKRELVTFPGIAQTLIMLQRQ